MKELCFAEIFSSSQSETKKYSGFKKKFQIPNFLKLNLKKQQNSKPIIKILNLQHVKK